MSRQRPCSGFRCWRWPLLLALFCALPATGCTQASTTGMVLEVATTCAIPTEIDELLIRVATTTGKKLPEVRRGLTAAQSAGSRRTLGRLGLAPEFEPPLASTVDIETVGLRTGQEVVSARARAAFVKDQVVTVTLTLAKECLGRTCAPGLTCEARQGAPTCLPADQPSAGVDGGAGAAATAEVGP